MAERRMFSKRLVGSAKFLKMPKSTQVLYIYLVMNADDNGVVEAYGVLKSLRCSEVDVEILVEKNYIKILNEDLLVYITDWKEHNPQEGE